MLVMTPVTLLFDALQHCSSCLRQRPLPLERLICAVLYFVWGLDVPHYNRDNHRTLSTHCWIKRMVLSGWGP